MTPHSAAAQVNVPIGGTPRGSSQHPYAGAGAGGYDYGDDGGYGQPQAQQPARPAGGDECLVELPVAGFPVVEHAGRVDVQALLGPGATLECVADETGAAPAARSASDFSYAADCYAGEGWRIVGDAGGAWFGFSCRRCRWRRVFWR